MALDPQLLQQLLGTHPARRIPYDPLRAGLLMGVANKHINLSRDGDLELFGYSSTCQFEQEWNLFSLIARGLILDSVEKRVVATPFPKFFNFNEGGIPLPNEPFEVTEKIDGSLGILFHHHEQWRVSTRGRLSSMQGEWATRYLNSQIRTENLTPGTTYLVEIVYRENQVVIPYAFEGLVLLAAYDEMGTELSRESLQSAALDSGLRICQSVACASFDDLLTAANSLTRHEEGYVIRFAGGLRIKLKGEAYCRVHKLVCHCTPLALWDSMMNGEDFEAIRRELPEEMHADFDSILQLLQMRFDHLLTDIRAGNERFSGQTSKELGLIVQDPNSKLTLPQRKFAFSSRKPGFWEAVHKPGEFREKLFKLFRPDGNRLEGYVASDAITRFEEEQG